ISPKMRSDKNGIDGKYTVTSLYFESPDKTIYFETKNKLRYRQKLRLRVYDDTDENGTALFEIKQKHKKVVNKRRMLLTLKDAKSNEQVMREIHYFRQLYALYPEMIVSYDRHALHGIEDTELRMTFDFNLQCRNYDLLLEHGPYGKQFIDPDLVVLEVKVND